MADGIGTIAWLAMGVFLLAGTIKGIIGMGLPVTAVGILSQFTDPRTAVSLTILPIVVTNCWQLYRAGRVRQTIKEFSPFVIMLSLFMLPASLFSGAIPGDIMLLIVGTAIILFVLDAVRSNPWHIPPEKDKSMQLLFGSVGGIMGGISGIWSPAMVGFLIARRTEKEVFISALGFMMLSGGVFLGIGYYHNGFLTPERIKLSLLLVLISVVGFTIGEQIRKRVSAERFRLLILMFLFLLASNMIRRALM